MKKIILAVLICLVPCLGMAESGPEVKGLKLRPIEKRPTVKPDILKSNHDAFSKVVSTINLTTYCLEHHYFVPTPGEQACMMANSAYACIVKGMREEKQKEACPSGTYLFHPTEISYTCASPNQFEPKCLDGYHLSFDMSKCDPKGSNYSGYTCYARCALDGWPEYGLTDLCGNSGAVFLGKALVPKQEGYCCAYLEE